MAQDRDTFVENVLNDIIKKHKPTLTELLDADKARDIRAEAISKINDVISLNNQLVDKANKLKTLTNLPGYAIAHMLIATDDVKRMRTGSSGYKIVCKRYYNDAAGDIKWSGTYEIINPDDYDNTVMRVLTNISPDASRHDELSCMRYLSNAAPTVTLHEDNNLVYFRNGVFDFRNKTLTSYDDSDYESKYGNTVSLSKLPVNHPLGVGAELSVDASGNLSEPFITNPDGTAWHPSDCFTAPFDMASATGQACSKIVWELVQFTIRHMNGAPHLYHFWCDAGGKGHNGKSTLWECIHRLLEKQIEPDDDDLVSSGAAVINCAIENLDKDYVLSQNITTAYAIVGEESDAATQYIDSCAMVKMLSRAQECTFRQIRQAPFSFTYQGALIQQINKAPQFSEKSDAMYSHSVNIPFVNSFNDDRAYIKDDYVKREATAEWIAWHVTMEMDRLDAYDSDALATLEPFKREMLTSVTPTMQALDDILCGLNMNFIPSELAYDLYIRWCDKNGVNGRGVVSLKVFRDDLEQYAISHAELFDYTKKYARGSMKDLDNEHPALREFGYSRSKYYTQFIDCRAFAGVGNADNASRYLEKLERTQWLGSDGKPRLWTHGGLVRVVKWQDIRTDAHEELTFED